MQLGEFAIEAQDCGGYCQASAFLDEGSKLMRCSLGLEESGSYSLWISAVRPSLGQKQCSAGFKGTTSEWDLVRQPPLGDASDEWFTDELEAKVMPLFTAALLKTLVLRCALIAADETLMEEAELKRELLDVQLRESNWRMMAMNAKESN